MLSTPFIAVAALALARTINAAPKASLSERAVKICYASETPDLDVDPADVAFIAAYLRSYGKQTRLGRLFNQAAADSSDCAEWSLYAHGSALALAKRINSTIGDVSVLFADIADTIDGGEKATPEQQADSLLGCGSSGGSYGVKANLSAPAYTASSYPAGYTPNGLLVKIVWSGV